MNQQGYFTLITINSHGSLVVSDLTLHAGRRVIARNISFVSEPGRITWVIGENGAGKSTLIRMLARQVSSVAYYNPGMGIPTHTTLKIWQDRQDMLEASFRIDSTVDELMPEISASTLLSRLSTGESKRVLLVSLLRSIRRFTFLDEPFEHLSPTSKRVLAAILARRSSESTVIVATNQDVPDGIDASIVEVA
jgi:ABC-type multidrug transport system ATPase subunit